MKHSNMITAVAGLLATTDMFVENDALDEINGHVMTEDDGDSAVQNIFAQLETRLAVIDDDSFTEADEAGKIAALRMSSAIMSPDKSKPYVENVVDGYTVKRSGIVKKPEVMVEAFSDEDPSNLAAISFKYNLGATRQDEFSKAIFPMYVGKPGSTGITFTAKVDYLHGQFARTLEQGTKFDKELLVKIYADINGPLRENRLELHPVDDGNNDAYLQKVLPGSLTELEDRDGTTYNTAPLKFGVDIPLITIGQSPATVAIGEAQETTTLDSSISLKRLILNIGGIGSYISSKYLAGAKFGYSRIGTTQEIDLTLVVPELKITYGDLPALDPNAPIVSIPGLENTHYGIYKLVIKGEGNIETGTIVVYDTKFELVKLYTNAGAVETTQALIDEANTLQLEAYEVESFITNEDANELGLIVTDTEVTANYIVKPLPPRAAAGTIKGLSSGISSEAVDKLINITYYDMALETIHRLTEIADFCRNNYSDNIINNTGLETNNVDGIGKYFVNPYFKSVSINVNSILNSTETHKKLRDIQSVLMLNIKKMVSTMINKSGYGTAKDTVKGTSRTIDVVIATNDDIASWLPSEIDLGQGKRVKVVTRRDKVGGMAGKIYILFSTFNPSPTQIDPLAFGATTYIPVPIGEGTRTIGKSTIKVIVTNAQIGCVSHTYILGEINVDGLTDAVESKTSIHMV